MGWSGRESRKQGRSGPSSGRGEVVRGRGSWEEAASGRSVPPEPAGGGRRRGRGEGPQARPRRRQPWGRVTAAALRPSKPASRSVASSPASSESKARKTRGQPRKPSATFSTPWVPRAATAGTPQLRKGKPVEDALGHDREGRRGAETPKPKHRLGAGQRLEPGRPVGVYGPPDKPADKTAGGVGNDHHPCEPLTALGEQPAVPEPSRH